MRKNSFSKSKFFYGNLSIAWKYLIGLISVIFIAALVGYFILARVAQVSLERAIGDSSVLFAQVIMDKIDRVLFDRIEYWRSYSTEQELIDNVRVASEESNSIINFEEYVEERDKTWRISASRDKEDWMLDLYNNDESLDLRRINEFFADEYGYNLFGEVFITDRRGLITALSSWTTDYYQADELWWQETMQNGLYVSDVVFDESSQVRALELGIRVDDEQGEVLGVMKVILNVQEVVDIVDQFIIEERGGMSETLHAKILDRNQEIIYSSKSTGHDHLVLEEMISKFHNEENLDYWLFEEGDEDSIEKEFIIWAESRGYKDFSGIDWVLLLEYDADQIFAAVVRLKNIFLLIILGAVSFLIILSFFISRLITKLIQELVDVMELLEKGEKDERVDVKSKDEIGVLAQNFNNMADKLMEVDRLKTEFLSIATHQLRTPLGIIRWNLELLLSGDKGKISRPVKAAVKDIYENNVRLTQLVNDLLNISRLDQGRVPDKSEETDLVAVVQEMVSDFKGQAKEKHIIINLQIECTIPKVLIDAERFREVVENLLSNSIKYNKEKGSIKVKMECLKGEIILSVKDTGIGIPKEDQEKLFSKFFRGSNAVSSDTTGSGLGLYVIREYVRGWGGEISFTSSEEGTEFIVKLPQKPKKIFSTNTSDRNYAVVENNVNGYALHEIVTDDKGKPIDYIFKEVNEVFENITGLKKKDIIGKKVTEVLPGIEKDKGNWIEKYGKVALDQKELKFKQFSEPLGRWYSVVASSPTKGMFVTIFQDITDLKETNKKLEKRVEEVKS
jgi:PAS domain S-box-containing protein